MRRNKIVSKWIAMALTFSMLFSLMPEWFLTKAEAASGDLEVRFGAGTLIGNASHDADNAFLNFYNNQTPGFKQIDRDRDEYAQIDWAKGDIFTGKEDKNTWVEFEIKVANNPALMDLAQSGHAEAVFGWSRLKYYSGLFWTRVTEMTITVDGTEVLHGKTSGGDVSARSASAVIKPNSVIRIVLFGEGKDGSDLTGVRDFYVKFQDQTRPVLNNYTFIGNGAQRDNTNLGQRELYVKQDEYISLAYNFSEPVKPTALNSAYHEHFLRQPLFTNPSGTGLPAAGQQQYLDNETYNSGNLKEYKKSVVFSYTASKYHQSDNLPVEPKITGSTSGVPPLNKSLEEKIKEAVFADAAGNVATTQFPNKASLASNSYLAGKTVNPFDYKNSGYRVIVDAVAPKYTKVGNGIQPEILTGVTLNKDDTIDFTLQMTEEAVVKDGWDVKDTYLLLNNGLKAGYASGSNTKNWTFRVKIPDGVNVETPLLKVIALTHKNKMDDSDTSVIQDYAGNMLIQPANFEGIHKDGDESNVNSKIDWATLSIDNTKPEIGFHYETGGASNEKYQKNGKITIDANDPPLIIPSLDPNIADRGKERPSKGIYRPSNMSGPASPAVGLVYYLWSQNPADPFADQSGDHYAAIKRYSLSAKQPADELYPGQFAGVQLRVVNNKTNMLAPPVEALTEPGSGEWYLHSWTADMTWDTARELMQYEKMKAFRENNPGQYAAWKAEATGSESDKIFYADNKALAAVGQYGDLSIWPLTDFKQQDSNWDYKVAAIKLDNLAPIVTMGEINGDNTANVRISVKIEDEHSGLKDSYYQWVKAGDQPQDINWNAIGLVENSVNLSTQNEVMEDGSYLLYIKAADQAGNERIVQTETPITVNSEEQVHGRFEPETNTSYVKSHDVLFYISGITPQSVTSGTYGGSVSEITYQSHVSYAINSSTIRPEEAAYTELIANGMNNDSGQQSYLIPANSALNGIYYVHIKVEAEGPYGARYYYYSKAYYFDNLAPDISFSKNGVAYPQASHELTVTVTEPYSTDGLIQQYQWVKSGDALPDDASPNWMPIPQDGRVIITDTGLQDGEIAYYQLYVRAVDGAGNSLIASTTDTFTVSKVGGGTPPASSKSDLIYVYGDAEDGYTAIVKLSLDTLDKSGYEFSVSPDDGESWVKWRPYTNFVAIKVPTDRVSDLKIKVKYKTPGGAIGDPQALDTKAVSVVEPVYALASLSTTRPVSPITGVDIDVVTPLGIKVVPSAVNPSDPVRSGNKFNVKKNGYYTFNLTDTADPSRIETLIVVVNNVDGTPPQGSIEYLTTRPTNGNVSVKLETSKPVQITNNMGKAVYTFTENGSFTFEFRDEAGNNGTATATVTNIDKEGPKVKIVRSYTYGANNSQSFGTILDNNGQVRFSSGVTLEVQKADENAKDFIVLDEKKAVTMLKNGSISFMVADLFGNTTVIKEEIDNILAAPPEAKTITYTFVNEEGKPLEKNEIVTIDGKQYARGKVQVTLSGQTTAPNMVFSGVTPIRQDGTGNYTNQISGSDGSFTYSRIFGAEGSTSIALSDLLGNVNKVPVEIKGLDNKPPEIKLNQAAAGIVQNKQNFDLYKDLGGYTVSDNVSQASHIKVTHSGLDLTKLGRQRVTYTATDQVGNTAVAVQDVIVVGSDGMLIFADDVLISGAAGESALFDRNKLTFKVERYNLLDVNGQIRTNEWGTYDLLYQPGLYREGQMKYIASKITYKELVNGHFEVTFPQVGWYTLIVRNQEREREYATFFIGKLE
ncbi:hypothetical protein [Paenibacillus eucommiae]|uniref:DUF5011 domain-containing protein n=1 Tax=Paenibacillus eucommiae TaxID=1355755 RepID=A0ABS4IXW8_9BACL|nr:hypothetical protein [Paenibacillus eucommiae]MBP1991930.1 hypothetical protein [Paenibacillus eucommiae]